MAALTACATTVALAAPVARAEGRVHSVAPGGSVQAAVDAAAPGDVVELAAGTYEGSVFIATDRVTLRGPRGGGAEIVPVPGAKAASSGARPASSDAKTAAAVGARDGAAEACVQAGHGICVFGTPEHPVSGVRVESVTVSGFPGSGVMGKHADGLTVAAVTARHNGAHGIGQEFSAHGVFSGNVAEDNVQSGLFVGDETSGPGSAVAGNRASGNRIGVHLRRTTHIAVTANRLTANCAGVFVVGDETRPVAGDLDIAGNTLAANNRYCPGNDRIAHIQGSGIVLTGAQGVRVRANIITDNQGDSPMSGGIAMVPSFTGEGTSFQEITANTLLRNAPADIAERDPRGTGNRYAANSCATAQPTHICGG
ncbi:right-handed parallel beta-helix repeat-containing protein [Yinghuangia sp. YIM S09857]|uniref:right-handed parallel beta-helix repeat-containing protein n=1 Tax=Yinghuangia sp. YIM S09857 TaxID=3436929 RepID=UPI003F5386B4